MKLEALEILKMIGAEETTTARQKANGTREFTLKQRQLSSNGSSRPIKFAIYETGYVRKTAPLQIYQINPVVLLKTVYSDYVFNKETLKTEEKRITKLRYRRILIHDEETRLRFLVKFILKNIVAKQAFFVDKQTIDNIKENFTLAKVHYYGEE
jgi:hypothetical protein